MRLIVLCLLSVVLAGCATVLKGPKMNEVYPTLPRLNSDQSRLVFIRPGEEAFGNDVRVFVNEEKIVELPLSGCFRHQVHSGTHELKVDLWGDLGSHEMELIAEGGKSYFFNISPRQSRQIMGALFGVVGTVLENVGSDSKNDGNFEMIPLPEDEALPMLSQCVDYDEAAQEG